jgi:hypothetical protein
MAHSSSFKSSWTQFFPPKPKCTGNNLPTDLYGKVNMVTGTNCGMGKELGQVLYAKNAKVYVIWLSSFGLVQYAPEDRGLKLDNLDYHIPKPHVDRYGISK